MYDHHYHGLKQNHGNDFTVMMETIVIFNLKAKNFIFYFKIIKNLKSLPLLTNSKNFSIKLNNIQKKYLPLVMTKLFSKIKTDTSLKNILQN